MTGHHRLVLDRTGYHDNGKVWKQFALDAPGKLGTPGEPPREHDQIDRALDGREFHNGTGNVGREKVDHQLDLVPLALDGAGIPEMQQGAEVVRAGEIYQPSLAEEVFFQFMETHLAVVDRLHETVERQGAGAVRARNTGECIDQIPRLPIHMPDDRYAAPQMRADARESIRLASDDGAGESMNRLVAQVVGARSVTENP